MGAGPSSTNKNHVRIMEVLKRTPFMQMMDDKILSEIAECFQIVKYSKGAKIKNEPWLFFIVAEGSVDISSLIPTGNRKHLLHEVLCQRKVGDYISFAARDLLLGRLMDESVARARRTGTDGSATTRVARKNLMAMLDLNHSTADLFTGCTLLKLNRDRFLKLRTRLESGRSSRNDTMINHTRRFSDEDDDARLAGGVPRTQRRSIVMTGPEKMNLLSAIVESDIVNFLFDIPFLEGVDQSRLVTLSNLCSYVFIRKGDVLCQEGEIGDRFFICIRGTLQATAQAVSRHNKSGETANLGTPALAHANSKRQQHPDRKIQALKKMGPGAYFGEISLLFKIPRICSITALEDSLLVYIDRVAFCNFLKIVPEANLVLLEHVRLNFIDTLIKQGCTFLNAMPVMKRQELSYIGEIVEHTANETILEKGVVHSGFYIVLRGEVEVEYIPRHRCSAAAKHASTDPVFDGEITDVRPPSPRREIIRVRPGGYFGQETIILDEPSLVSVKCLDHSLTLRLSADAFREFFSSAPALYAEFCIKCLRDKSRPEHVMQHYDAHQLWGADCVNRRRQLELKLFESIEDFKWDADFSEGNTVELALMVYMRFLSDTAPLHVQIPSAILDKIEDELASQRADRDIFDEARSEILTRMEDAHFEAFKQSDLFQEFLTALHCPQTIYDGLTTRHLSRLDMSHTTKRLGDEGYVTRMKLEDVDEEITQAFETRTKAVNTANGGGAVSAKSFGRGMSQKRYSVAASNPQAPGMSSGRRQSPVDATALPRAQSSVSSTFVF